jgi:nucleoside-diphosphate-sugar epimerase
MSQNELHVIFGTGALGKWTARELIKLGRSVRMISHSGRPDSRIPAEVEIVQGDAYDTAHNIEVTKGAAAVYQCAQPHYYEWPEKFPPMQKAILEAVAVNGAKFIVGDNLYMYGDTNGQPIREDLPYQAHTKKGRVRAEMANAVMEAHHAGKIRAAIGRASNFFGPDDTAVTSYAIRPALAGKPVNLLGKTDQPHTFSYVADFGKLLATLGTRDETLGQVWFTPSPAPVTQAELVRIMEEVLERKVKSMAAGKAMMTVLGLFMPDLRESVEMLYEWDKPFIVDTSKAEKAFGWKGTSLQVAMQETIDWCKTHPEEK